MASCTALGPDHVFSIGLQLGLGCATTAKYTLPVPPATCVSTVTSYNPLATSATQQLDVIAPSIATSTFSSGTMLYTYNINNYAQTLAFPATTSVAANPASTTTVTATLSGQGLPYTLTYASGFHWNQQTIAAWQTSGTQCQVVATAAGTANLVSTGTTTTTVANGAVVTNVVMVGWVSSCASSLYCCAHFNVSLPQCL
ncbi:hypothetical protein BC830DRAFT_699456 [Chytriomyces sp. MP71]|nr:hypothetical protein BC830DRAFT_699456 [Chytriomyces sp. MP71]